jgi:membrane protease YdiL (CAAX protease family)
MWQHFSTIEPIFGILMLSYLTVVIVAVFLLKKDSKRSLSKVFANSSPSMIIVGMIFAFIYLGVWYLISFLLGSEFEFTSSTILRDYEAYTISSFPLAFALYLGFSVFGAFAEEVAYRGYVQTRISSRYGYVVGILVAALFFSLAHIHVFQAGWIVRFFQTQFFHVFLFGIFCGYLFFESKENIWCVFSMHALTNAFSVSVPIVVIPKFEFTYYIAETASFITMILLLHFLPLKK